MRFPDKVVFEGFNKNLMLFNYKPTSKNEKFSFDQRKNVWYNEFTDRVMSTDHKNPMAAGANVATHEYHPDEKFHQWELVSCEDPADEEARLVKESADAKEELGGEEVDGEKKTEEDDDSKDEDPAKVDEGNKKVVEDQAKENKKKQEKEEDGETASPPNSVKKEEETPKSESEKSEDEAEE